MTLAANGIKAYKFESLRPTPELSFAVRELGCIAGMLKAQLFHNPSCRDIASAVKRSDPDADRLGVYVKDDKSGEYIPLTGNMSGSLLCEYVLSQKQAAGN